MRLTRKTTSDKEIIVSLLRRTKKEYYKNLDPQKVPDNRTFWRTVKPFLCNKSVENEKKNILVEKEEILKNDGFVAS